MRNQNRFEKKPFVKKPRTKQGTKITVKYPPNASDEQKQKSISQAMRRFKKMVSDEGIIQEYRECQFYQKPSVVRNKKKAIARKRWLKKQRDMEEDRGF